MFGFSPKLPVSDDERQWVDEGFVRLEKLLGKRRMLDARVILPSAEDFPDRYDRTAEAAESLFSRVCTYMDVDRDSIEFEIFPDEVDGLKEVLPYWRGNSDRCAAGLYIHGQEEESHHLQSVVQSKRMVVAIRSSQLRDPLPLIATMAHELGHVILLGGKLLDPKTPDHEPLTDLLTVFLGFGVFTANSAGRFKQYTEGHSQGWSMQRLGYLPEEVYGYALAKFVIERGERKVHWEKLLSTNVKAYFKSSLAWLLKNIHI